MKHRELHTLSYLSHTACFFALLVTLLPHHVSAQPFEDPLPLNGLPGEKCLPTSESHHDAQIKNHGPKDSGFFDGLLDLTSTVFRDLVIIFVPDKSPPKPCPRAAPPSTP